MLSLWACTPLWGQSQQPTFARYEVFHYYRQAVSLYQQGLYYESRLVLDKVLSINPKHKDAYQLRGNVNFLQEAYEQALRDYSQAIQLAEKQQKQTGVPSIHEARSGGISIMDPPFSQSYFRKSDAWLYNNRGAVLYQLGQHQHAITEFRRAIEMDPNFTLAQTNLELCQQGVGGYGEYIAERSLTPPVQDLPTYGAQIPTAAPPSTQVPRAGYFPYTSSPERQPAVGYGNSRYTPAETQRSPIFQPAQPTVASSYPQVRAGQTGLLQSPKRFLNPVVQSQQHHYVNIRAVELKGASTWVHIEINNQEHAERRYFFERPGKPGAFFLTNHDRTQVYPLTGIRGVQPRSYGITIPAGKIVHIELEFPRIPANWQTLHVFEGHNANPHNWNFYDVILSEMAPQVLRQTSRY